MKDHELITLLRAALTQFVQREREYALTTVSERSLCARLATILENLAKNYGLIGYYADVENNRKQQGEVKTILDDNEELLSNLVYGMVLIRRRACMDRCDCLIRFH